MHKWTIGQNMSTGTKPAETTTGQLPVLILKVDDRVFLQQRQEQERSAAENSTASETVLADAVHAAQHVSVSSVTTVTTSCEMLPAWPLIPFGQGRLPGSGT